MNSKDEANKLSDSETNWIAIQKGDRVIAKKMIRHLAGTLLIDGELTRTERHRLASALLNHEDSPEAFFGFGRTGPKATQTAEKISMWQAVTDHKEQLKSEGKKVVDAIGDVAEDFDCSETKVKKAFDEIQRHIKVNKEMNQGITTLLP